MYSDESNSGVIYSLTKQHTAGSGRFLMWLAKRNLHSKNYLGLEIRKKVCCEVHK